MPQRDGLFGVSHIGGVDGLGFLPNYNLRSWPLDSMNQRPDLRSSGTYANGAVVIG